MRRKRAIRGDTLALVHMGRPDTRRPFEFFLTFENAAGPGDMAGREVNTRMSCREVATVLGTVQQRLIDAHNVTGDGAAIRQVMALLRWIDDNETGVRP